jgi:hypothetical protein
MLHHVGIASRVEGEENSLDLADPLLWLRG